MFCVSGFEASCNGRGGVWGGGWRGYICIYPGDLGAKKVALKRPAASIPGTDKLPKTCNGTPTKAVGAFTVGNYKVYTDINNKRWHVLKSGERVGNN